MSARGKKLEPVKTANLTDIMSEQLISKIEHQENTEIDDEEFARQLQAQFDQENSEHSEQTPVKNLENPQDHQHTQSTCKSDLELAMDLQKVYDSENYEAYGKNNRFLADRPIFANETEYDEEDYYYQGAYDNSEIPKIYGKELLWDDDRAQYISKHDKLITDKNNVRRLEELPNSINTGRMEGLTLDSKTFNRIKQHSTKMKKQHARLHESKEKTPKGNLDILS